jgi:hypothetical protein
MINSTRSGHKERWLRQLTVVAASSTAAPQLLSGDRIVLPTTALTELDSFIQPGKPVTLELLSGLTKAVRYTFAKVNSHSIAYKHKTGNPPHPTPSHHRLKRAMIWVPSSQ